MNADISSLLRCPSGPVDVRSFDPQATPGFPKKSDKDDAERLIADLEPDLDDAQERLYAAGLSLGEQAPSVLLILQGLDTAGKGGVIRHVVGQVDPQGLQLASFKKPTAEERAHDFLWRIEKALPAPGRIGIFDRSHYEDVLVVRVESLVPEDVWSKRYDEINEFEAELVAGGTKLIKCMLNVSFAEQLARLKARLDDPTKYWKYNPGDLDARAKWPAYQEAYAAVLEKCNTEAAPWYVIPADRKWYRNWAVAELLRETLDGMSLSWPVADFDVEVEKKRVAES